jgi:hypothetical protein
MEILAIEDFMLQGNDVGQVLRRLPLPSDTPDLSGLVKKRLESWYDAKTPCDGVRVVRPSGEELARHTVWDILKERSLPPAKA